MLWDEDVDYEFAEYTLNGQFVPLYFFEIDAGVESLGEAKLAAKIPYSRIVPTTDEAFVASLIVMVSTDSDIGSDPGWLWFGVFRQKWEIKRFAHESSQACPVVRSVFSLLALLQNTK